MQTIQRQKLKNSDIESPNVSVPREGWWRQVHRGATLAKLNRTKTLNEGRQRRKKAGKTHQTLGTAARTAARSVPWRPASLPTNALDTDSTCTLDHVRKRTVLHQLYVVVQRVSYWYLLLAVFPVVINGNDYVLIEVYLFFCIRWMRATLLCRLVGFGAHVEERQDYSPHHMLRKCHKTRSRITLNWTKTRKWHQSLQRSQS